MTKRCIDIILSLILIIFFSLPFLLIALLIILTSKGPVLYWSNRVGLNNNIYSMPKFRTMKLSTPLVDTASLEAPEIYITKVGTFLRAFSLDELPQLFTVLLGQMSFVGPRPALPSQKELIKLRTEESLHTIKPGITGLAQINGRDNLSVEKKIFYDKIYLNKKSVFYDFSIMLKTIFVVIIRRNVSH